MATKKLRTAMAGPQDELKMDMSPMIDMVFLLLIFFLVNAQMIVVKLDKRVAPPVASNTLPDPVANGRIVINVFEDGTFANEDGQKLEEDDIFEVIKDQKAINEQRGYDSRIHLRGDKAVEFRFCRKVLRIAARAGVDQVIFATYQVE